MLCITYLLLYGEFIISYVISQNEEVEEKAGEVLPSSLLTQLANSNWKERLAACEEFQKVN